LTPPLCIIKKEANVPDNDHAPAPAPEAKPQDK
jgi:hypothetical protein